jgi:hypothetical protein
MMNLKIPLVLTVVLAFCALGTTKAQLTTGVPVVVDVGNTNSPYVSYLVIDDQSLGNSAIEYAWYYSSTTETDGVTPLTGEDLLDAVIAGSADTVYALDRIDDSVVNTNTNSGPGLIKNWAGFTDGFQIGSTTSTLLGSLTTTNADWAYWVKGGELDDSLVGTNWSIANDVAFYRTITNGSFDGWTISPYDPNTYLYLGGAPLSAAAVPEPSTLPLMLLSLATVVAVFRWKSSERNSTL